MSMALVLAMPSVPYARRRDLLPNRPGLYFVVRDRTEVMYIGMSRKSILRRWMFGHHVAYDIQNSGLTERAEIAYVVYDDVSRIGRDELAAIHEFRPPWNDGHIPAPSAKQALGIKES